MEEKKRNVALNSKLVTESARNAELKKNHIIAGEALGKSLVRAHLVNELVHLVHRCWPGSSHHVNCC